MVEQGERRAVWASVLSASLMIAQQVGGKATRDALFLSSFAAEDLPRVVIASAVASLVAVFAASKAFARWGPARVVPVAFMLSSALYVAEWVLLPSAPQFVAVAIYLHKAVFGALVVSGFWSVINERFDPHTAKSVIGRIGAGATFGGVAGGVLAERVGALGTASTMLWALAALNLFAAIGVWRIGPPARRTVAPHSPSTKNENPMDFLGRSPYLRALAAMVLLTSASGALLDYAFKANAAEQYSAGSHALLSFFAIFHTVSSIGSFLLQTGLTRPVLNRLGVGGAVSTLPIVVLLTASVGAAVSRFYTIVIARGAELILANSVFRSGYELLYTPVSAGAKRRTKPFIDVVGHRAGDALGSGLVLAILWAVDANTTQIVLALAAAGGLISLVIARRLNRGYVGQLEQRLRKDTDPSPDLSLMNLDANTLQTLSTLGLDRDALFERLAAHRSWDGSDSLVGDSGHSPPTEPGLIDAPPDDPVHRAAATFRSGTPHAVREELRSGRLDERLIGHAIALLARRDVYQTAVLALRDIVDVSVEQLAHALLDPDQPFAIRRRIPRVLEAADDPKAVNGLVDALTDERFEVRYRSALALARILARNTELRADAAKIHEAVNRELDAGRRVWDSRRLLDEDDGEEEVPLLDRALRDRVHRSLEHVFTLLSAVYDPEILRLALTALAGEDATMRGTALEYLENVLPEDLRARLWPMLDVRVQIRRTRSRQEIVDDLVRSFHSMDARALAKAIEKHTSEKPPAPETPPESEDQS